MDMQKLIDVMSNSAARERSKYHLTLGGLIADLEQGPLDTAVTFDNGFSPINPHSYRGYYSDLAFEGSTTMPVTAGSLLAITKGCVGATFEGYKGGDFVMTEKTPLWCASYGSCGRAIIALTRTDHQIVLVTKDVD